MGLFGRKQTTATTTQIKGFGTSCGPQCGFLLRNPSLDETAQMLQMHAKQSHKTNMTMDEARKGVTPMTWTV